MVGDRVHREVAEPIFMEALKQMTDGELESEARGWVWLCETRLDGPWTEDVWHRNCIRQEFEQRKKLEIFLRAQQRILIQLGKAPMGSTIP